MQDDEKSSVLQKLGRSQGIGAMVLPKNSKKVQSLR